MGYLLDTHALIWLLEDESRIPAQTLQLLKNPATPLVVSLVSFWEIAVKTSIGKLKLTHPIESIEAAFRQQGAKVLTISLDHILPVQTLPFHHRDPFDRMLIAQAMEENLTLVSDDSKFAPYPVNVLW